MWTSMELLGWASTLLGRCAILCHTLASVPQWYTLLYTVAQVGHEADASQLSPGRIYRNISPKTYERNFLISELL